MHDNGKAADADALRARNRDRLIELMTLMKTLDHSKPSAAAGGYAKGRYPDFYNADGRLEIPFLPAGLRKYRQGREEHAADAEMRFNLFQESRWTTPFEIHDFLDPNKFLLFVSGENVTRGGKSYSNDYAFFAIFRDGKLDLLREMVDPARASILMDEIPDNDLFRSDAG